MGELQTTRGQETGDETNSEQTRHGATEAVTRTTNSKGSEYGAGAMNCSRPGWLILLHRMPWTQGNWLPCPWQRPRTRGSTPGSGCGRCARRHYQTLLSVLIHLQCLEPSLYRRFTPPNRHDSASPGRDSGQGNQKAAGRLAAWGSNTHQRLATCEPLRAPILDWGPKPSFRPCDSLGLAVNCPCPAWQAADLGRPSESRSRASKMALETWTNTTAFFNHSATTEHHSHPLTGARSHPDAEFEFRPAPATQPPPPVEVQWNRRVTVCSSARLLVYSSTRLLSPSTRLSLASM